MADEDDDWHDAAPASPDEGDDDTATPDNLTQAAPSDDDDWHDAPADQWSTGGALAVGAAKGAAPAAGGLGAGIYAGAAATPFLGPIGGLAVGLGTGMGAGYLIQKGEDWVLNALGLSDSVDAAQQQHPIASAIGEALPAVAMLRPNARSLDLGMRALGAGMGGGIEAGMEKINGQDLDPTRIAVAAGTGAALPRLNRFGSRVEAAGAQAGARYRGGNTADAALSPNEGGANRNPDLKPEPPAEEIPDVTDMEVANDVTTTAPGVAADNSPAPEISGVGNPGAGAGTKHAAEGPENYAKAGAEGVNPVSGKAEAQPSVAMEHINDAKPVSEEISAALGGEDGQSSLPDVRSDEAPLTPDQETGNLAAQQEQRQQAVQPPQGLDPVEASRAQREALEGVKERQAAMNGGEDWHDLPQGPISPEQRRYLTENRKMLVDAGMKRVLAHLDRLPEPQQVRAVSQIANALQSKSGEATGIEADRMTPKERPTISTGAMARSKADAARKEASVKAVKSVYDEYGPKSEKGKEIDPTDMAKRSDNLDALKKIWSDVVERNGGKDPLSRADSYIPTMKGHPNTEAYQWLRGVRDAIKGKGWKRFATMHQGDMGALDAETGQIEGDIMHRPQLPEAAEQNETATGAREVSRESIEHITGDPRPGADNSYSESFNKLADWINERSNAEYEKLSEQYDLRTEMDEPADPAELHSDMLQTLADTGKRPGVLEHPAEDTPGVSRRIEVPQLQGGKRFEPTEPGKAASAGKKIDLTTEAGRALAAKYGAVAPKARDTEARLASERNAGATPKGEEQEAIKGGWKDLFDRFKDDTSGALTIPAWMKPKPKDPLPDELRTEFHLNDGAMRRQDMKLTANYALSDKKPVAWMENLYKKMEERTPLTADEQAYYDKSLKPLVRRRDLLSDMVAKVDPEYAAKRGPAGWKGVSTDHMPRVVDRSAVKKAPEELAPWIEQNLNDWASHKEDRKWFALDDAQGQRIVFSMDDAGNLLIHRNKSAGKLKNVPPSFEGKLGDTLNLKVGGKATKFTVDDATATEIEKNVPGISFVKNPLVALSNEVKSLHNALIRNNMLKRLSQSPGVLANSTVDKDVARARGYALDTTKLDEMATRNGKLVYYSKPLKWLFDDFVKPGINDQDAISPINRFASAANNTLYFLSPTFHILNVADNWAHAMGQDLLKFRNYPAVPGAAMRAWKSVWTQDALQHEITSAGGRNMYTNQLLQGGAVNNIMRDMGIAIQKNPSIFDPITKATGVSVPDIARYAMEKSNRLMWFGNAFFYTALYNRNRFAGMTPGDAVKSTERWIGAYRPESQTFMGSRAAQKWLNTPAVSWFGAYHQDLWRSVGNIIKGLTTEISDPQKRKEAVGALVVSGMLMFGFYPMMDKAVQKLTGNEDAEFGRRGISALMDAGNKLATGEGDYTGIAHNVFTPSIPASLVTQGVNNRDWKGEQIVPPVPMNSTKNVAKSSGRLLDWALGITVPPYQAGSNEARQPEGSAGGVVKKLGESAVGIKDPTEAARKYKDLGEKYQVREEKKRMRKPGGLMESIINRATD